MVVAGAIAVMGLFYQEGANFFPFDGTSKPGEPLYITGSHWLAITILSLFGLFYSRVYFSVVFIHQVIYKGTYLIVSVLPSLIEGKNQDIPIGMSIFFLVWVIVLPFIIPWGFLLNIKNAGSSKISDFDINK